MSGHDTVTEVSEEGFTIIGRSSRLVFTFDKSIVFDLSGHYPLGEVRRDLVTESDPYFRRLNRVRSLSIRSEHGEANVVFGVGKET